MKVCSVHDEYEARLGAVEIEVHGVPVAPGGCLRIVSWNIEKGRRWQHLEACVSVEEIASADIVCLNEVDDGMARSGNRRIAFELADRLGMTCVFGPVYYEFTKGAGDDADSPGENTTAIQGNAVLTRLPVDGAQNLRLPFCFDAFRSEERRAGNRRALIVQLGGFTVVATHLEVYDTPLCRAKQMRGILDAIGSGPAIIAGDFNTNTFSRGAALRTFHSLARLLATDAARAVLQPQAREPLFFELGRSGFSCDGFNDGLPTCYAPLNSLEDQKYVPRFIRNRILRRIPGLNFRLDWIAARGFSAVRPGHTLCHLPAQPSDHWPIACDIALL